MLEVNNSSIRNSFREGARVQNSYSPAFNNCTIENNGFSGISIYDNAAPVINSCRFNNNNNKDIQTHLEGVGQLGNLDSLTVAIVSSTADQFTRMPALGNTGRYVLENTVAVSQSDTLLIEAGAKIWMSSSRYIQMNGTMIANGDRDRFHLFYERSHAS